ncbi:nucleotidyl transferase AbiEii/AbiGii toxin family protein [Antrihabitans stalagmiti]|uniref:nucleotidyl transferase AbiEii/AbiGii toxin family protein n=1 Tax=Antrihabitans stalagmiti TaxID=2799499 RepID=UPI001F22391F|nr:nucleotidyl transferase AbiEii/AbiGii toxin family protein [Antrihabitans stalagmiti]
MISFILAAISNHWADQLTFIGGTALARTNLPDGRLSEDIDLIARTSRSTIARQLDRELPDAFRRELGRLHWDPALSAVGDAGEAYLRSDDGLSVKIQLISQIGHPDWPTQRTQLDQRYDDAPAAALDVLTTPAFVAAKTAA